MKNKLIIIRIKYWSSSSWHFTLDARIELIGSTIWNFSWGTWDMWQHKYVPNQHKGTLDKKRSIIVQKVGVIGIKATKTNQITGVEKEHETWLKEMCCQTTHS